MLLDDLQQMYRQSYEENQSQLSYSEKEEDQEDLLQLEDHPLAWEPLDQPSRNNTFFNISNLELKQTQLGNGESQPVLNLEMEHHDGNHVGPDAWERPKNRVRKPVTKKKGNNNMIHFEFDFSKKEVHGEVFAKLVNKKKTRDYSEIDLEEIKQLNSLNHEYPIDTLSFAKAFSRTDRRFEDANQSKVEEVSQEMQLFDFMDG